MTPLQRIKEGIINNDMEQVIQGYAELTGEEVAISTGGDETQTEEVSEPQVSEPKARMPKSATEDFSITHNENSTTGKYAKHQSISAGENTFVDDGVEHKDISTPDVGRIKRRPPVEMVDVKCHVCGKSEQINPTYKSGEFYRCSRCVGG
jgi:hypothetical protein|tara:strand:- start:218 stop:667 length:450 start_codon:yes stop_codon:yes gene_type:complete